MTWLTTIFAIIPLVYTSVEIENVSGLWVAEEPMPPPEAPNYPTQMDKTIQEVDNDGAQIMMDDGSVWEVAPEGRNIAGGWIAGAAPVTIEKGGNSPYPYTITNKWTKSTVRARPLEAPIKKSPN